MGELHGRAVVGSDGCLRVALPGIHSNTEVIYTIEFQVVNDGGQTGPSLRPRRRSGAERMDSLRRLAGSIADETFMRLPQGDYEKQ